MLMFNLVLRVLVAYFIYIDCKKRGNETAVALLWAVGSGVIPIVGIPIYFLFGRKKKLQEKQGYDGIIDVEASVGEEIITCVSCGKEFEESLLECPHCHHAVKHG